MKWRSSFKTEVSIVLKFQFWTFENERTKIGQGWNFLVPLPWSWGHKLKKHWSYSKDMFNKSNKFKLFFLPHSKLTDDFIVNISFRIYPQLYFVVFGMDWTDLMVSLALPPALRSHPHVIKQVFAGCSRTGARQTRPPTHLSASLCWYHRHIRYGWSTSLVRCVEKISAVF